MVLFTQIAPSILSSSSLNEANFLKNSYNIDKSFFCKTSFSKFKENIVFRCAVEPEPKIKS